jgi:protein BCP1
LINVDFEFFGPEEIDFHGLKNLLRQTLDADAELIDLSALANLILSQPGIGSTIKVDGKESDPFAFLTVLNMQAHRDDQAIQQLAQYIAQQASKNPSLAPIRALFDPTSDATVGLILSERMHGMPTQLIPPMYKMLQEEIATAVNEKEPFVFSHFLVLSKTYIEVESKLDQEEDRPKKKKKAQGEPEMFYFHPEDECLEQLAMAYGGYSLVKEGAEGDSDARRAFQESGTKAQGHMILMAGDGLATTIQALEKFVQG